MKYVLVTGGVVSGLGKGVTASSVGVVLKACGLRVTSIKIDPYLNTDAGTMSPFEHGEVFVLDDGGEVDLDLGNYERFLDFRLTKDHNITSGKIYQSVIERERRGDYLGKTVQVIPHVTDEIKNWIQSVALVPVDGREGPADVCVIELGGTVGDIESKTFIEALGQLSFSSGEANFCVIHVSLITVLGDGDQKTKPTQHSVRELRALGLTPNFLACRCEQPLLEGTKQKLAQFCHVPVGNIIDVHNVPNIWHVPLLLQNQGAHKAILEQLDLQSVAILPDLREWSKRTEIFDNLTNPVRIALVGKYVGMQDSYLSVLKALLHACISCLVKPQIEWVAASDLVGNGASETYETAWRTLRTADCVLVPGGFGDRGVEGMILAANYARENKVPYLGICLGMQISVIEMARNVLGWKSANSTEFDDQTPNPVVIFMPEGSVSHKGGTMRLGSRRTWFQTPNCLTAKLYHKVKHVDERHRHRYEVNPEFVGALEERGLKFVGKDESCDRMEILELTDHPFYVGVQFHPEYKSRPGKPSPIFLGFIMAALGRLDQYLHKHQNGNLN